MYVCLYKCTNEIDVLSTYIVPTFAVNEYYGYGYYGYLHAGPLKRRQTRNKEHDYH